MRVSVVVVAAGEGRRFGAQKQFASLGGVPVVAWATRAARSVASEVVLVTPPGTAEDEGGAKHADVVVVGGATRAASVRAGLAAADADAQVVVIHDGARPLASPALFRAVVSAVLDGADGAVPVIAVSDTLKRVADGKVTDTVDRSGLFCVQTPQAFRAAVLRRAHEGTPEASDDAALLEAIGATVVAVPGESTNLKLTSPTDLVVAGALAEGLAWR